MAEFNAYDVSSLGRVRRGGRIRKLHVRNSGQAHGYPILTLSQEGRRKTMFVHALVCRAFHGEPPSDKHVVAHNNGIRDDNRPENLRWATPKENTADMKAHGTHLRGDDHPSSILTEDAVREIKAIGRSMSYAALGQRFGVSKWVIREIIKGRNWGHV